MKKALGTLTVVLITVLLSSLTAGAQDSCKTGSSQKNGTTVLSADGCKEVILVVDGTQVYPALVTTTQIPPTVTPVGTKSVEPTLNSTSILDKGSEVAFTDKASLLISNPAAEYLNVHIHPDFRDGYVYNDVMGRAGNGRYYPILCSGTDNWYKIGYNGYEGWIHAKGQNLYATVVNTNNISIPVCK